MTVWTSLLDSTVLSSYKQSYSKKLVNYHFLALRTEQSISDQLPLLSAIVLVITFLVVEELPHGDMCLWFRGYNKVTFQ